MRRPDRWLAGALAGLVMTFATLAPAQAMSAAHIPLPAVIYDLGALLSEAPLAGPETVLTEGVRGGFNLTGLGAEFDVYVTATTPATTDPQVRTLTIERPSPIGPQPHRLANLRVAEGVVVPGGILVLLSVNNSEVTVQLIPRSVVTDLEPNYRREDNFPEPKS